MPELELTVNGAARRLPRGCTVAKMLALLEYDPARVAVERNQEVVPRATYKDALLDDGDRVEVVTFVGGGS